MEAEEQPTAFTWRQIIGKQFWFTYEWTMPQAFVEFPGGFSSLCGDCRGHRLSTVTGEFEKNGTFAAIVKRNGQYFHCIQPMTMAEYQAINPVLSALVPASIVVGFEGKMSSGCL